MATTSERAAVDIEADLAACIETLSDVRDISVPTLGECAEGDDRLSALLKRLCGLKVQVRGTLREIKTPVECEFCQGYCKLTCAECLGDGYIGGLACWMCGGEGEVDCDDCNGEGVT